MKKVNSIEELQQLIEQEDFYYRGKRFESHSEIENAANEFFNENTAEYEDREKYYNSFGLDVGECFTSEVKVESYDGNDLNCLYKVHFYECYIDSGSSAEDYFYGYYITEH